MQQKPSARESIWLYLGFALAAAIIGIISGYLIFALDNPLFAIVGAIAIVFALITVTNTQFGLLVLVFMVYTRSSDVLVNFHHLPSIAKPYIALLIVAITLKWIIDGRISEGWTHAAILVGAYGLVVFSSLLYASDFEAATSAALNFLKDGIIAVVLVILLREAKVFQNVIWTLLLAGILIGSISAYQGITGTYNNDFGGFGQVGYQNIVGETEGNRLSGPVGDPNFYAQAMLVLIPIALNRFLKEKKWLLKILAGWAFLASTLAVIFSYSRGAVVAAIFMLIFGMLHSPPRPTDALVGILLLVLIITFIPSPYMERLATITDIFGGRNAVVGEVSYRGRTSEVIAAWLMFIDHPVFGVGVENYPAFYQQYSRKLGLDPRAEQRQAHNLYLQIAAETGLAGILVFGWLLKTMMSGLLNAWRKLKIYGFSKYAEITLSFATGVIGYLAAALFIHGAYPRYFWLLAGISLAIPNIAQNLIENTEKESRVSY